MRSIGNTRPRTIRVATYNIHKCIGIDGRYDPERTLAVVRELDADVVAIQEFENRPGRHSYDLVPADFAAAHGGQCLVQANLRQGTGIYANLLLSRLPVLQSRLITWQPLLWEPRGMIVADLAVEGEYTIRAVATHLSLWPPGRRTHVARVLRAVDNPARGVLLFLGDLNEWLPGFGASAPLSRRFGKYPSPATFPASRPRLALDRILVAPRTALVALQVHATPQARVASDHLPVVAEIAPGHSVPGTP